MAAKSRPVPSGEGLSKQSRKKRKDDELKGNPEVLYHDLAKDGSKTNLIFYSKYNSDWKSVLLEHYPNHSEHKIEKGHQIKVFENTHLSRAILTINIYANGTILIQDNKENHLQTFENDFPHLKAKVEERRVAPTTPEKPAINPPAPAPPTPTSPTPGIEEGLGQLNLKGSDPDQQDGGKEDVVDLK